MTKSDIILHLSEEFHLSPRHARLVVDSFFSNIVRSLQQGEKVILRGFGTFSVKVAKARVCHHPQTGERVEVGERRSVVFKTGHHLFSRMNKDSQ